MAFKVQNPEWGSQATLVAIGVTSYLHVLNWDLSQVSVRFPSWHEEAQAFHDPHLLTLRATQVHALANMIDHPRSVPLRVTPNANDLQRLLSTLANSGLMLKDLSQLARHDAQHPVVRAWIPVLNASSSLQGLWDWHREDLLKITLEDYLDALHPEDQGNHPNMVYAGVLRHWRQLGKLSALSEHLLREGAAPLFPPRTADNNDHEIIGRLKA